MFLDSDDYLTPGAIESMMSAKENVDIVQGGYSTFRYVNNEPKISQTFVSPKAITAQSNYHGILKGFPWGKIFSSSIFEKLCFPEKYWFEDTICAMMIHPDLKSFSYVPTDVYRYLKREDSITATYAGKPKTLDTYYITEGLLQERESAGMSMNQNLYEQMFRQIKINCLRISTLKNADIDKSVFILHCHLMDKYFSNPDLKVPEHFKPLADAIHCRDFGLYRLCCKML